MTLYFITGNKNKLAEIKALIPEVEQIQLDLHEIQEMDAHKIIREKIKEAFAHKKGRFIVEDTSLYIDKLKGLPGPLVKWFEETIGIQGIADLATGSKTAAKTLIGYAESPTAIHFFEGELSGKIVQPRGANGFGWDKIFQPEGHNKTLAEMTAEEKNQISMRRMALNKLKEFLQ
jgi:non-canonical purine NTP pyrophosphatase (RdgB/HAM1 family)